MRKVTARLLAFATAARGFAFAFVFRVAARGLALALAIAACSRPCMKLTDHAWPPAGFERTFVGSGATLTDLTDVKPRCAATDPTCGPDPYRSEHACYDPSAPRIPIQAPNDDGNARKRCAHDGECVRTACTTCTHYSVALGVSCAKKADIDFEEKEGVLCGCVDGGCWFFQN